MLGELSGALLGLIEVVIGGLDATILVRVLSRLHSVQVLGPLDFFLVTLALLLKLSQFVTGVVVLLAKGMATITLLSNITLAGEDLSLAARDLLTGRSNLSTQVIIRSVLFIEQEASIIDFFLESRQAHDIGIVASLEVIVLEKFFVLQMSVLCLNGVELVAECEIVLVALLNLEDLSLELGNK